MLEHYAMKSKDFCRALRQIWGRVPKAPVSTVASIIQKGKQFGTTSTLRRELGVTTSPVFTRTKLQHRSVEKGRSLADSQISKPGLMPNVMSGRNQAAVITWHGAWWQQHHAVETLFSNTN